ncbi:MAG: nucleoside hydrolase, partial [Saprospiraceae bacterium]|nr:nucleoside hydrolase [Saprospiraceae bacterium]
MMRILIFFLLLFLSYSQVLSQSSNRQEIPLIIDADTANEIDDLYAIVRALIAPELNVLAITSAHFRNSPFASENSVRESQILNEEIVELMNLDEVDLPIGSNQPLIDEKTPQLSQAAEYIIQKAHEMPQGQRLHVVVLGPCTNIASAILIDSTIIEKIEVSYIGFWHDRDKNTWSRLEFNSENDIKSVNVLLTTPGLKFNSMTATTSGKLLFDKEVARDKLFGRGSIKSSLFNRWLNHKRWWKDEDPHKKEWTMWDVAIIEALIHPEFTKTEMLKGPEPNNGELINVYTEIDVESMKSSFWNAIDKLPNKSEHVYFIQNVNVFSPSNGTVTEGQDVTVLYGRILDISD